MKKSILHSHPNEETNFSSNGSNLHYSDRNRSYSKSARKKYENQSGNVKPWNDEVLGTGKMPWKRVLYERQPYYRDNYYDPKVFFSQLKIVRPWYVDALSSSNHLLSRIRLWFVFYGQLVYHATMIMQQFSAISFFLSIHKFLLHGDLAFMHLFTLNVTFLVVGILIYYLFENPTKREKFSLVGFLKTIILFIMCLEMTSPIIKTLTSSISEDTIQALTIFLAVVHLVFHDYQHLNDKEPTLNVTNSNLSPGTTPPSSQGTVKPKPIPNTLKSSELLRHRKDVLFYKDENDERVISSKVLSLNTAIFTAILLASRLEDNDTVVGYVVLALISFFLFPILVALIKQKSSFLFLFFAVIQWIGTSYIVYNLDWTLFIAYEVLVFILWFFGPFLFLLMLPYKKAYHGPWDIAKI